MAMESLHHRQEGKRIAENETLITLSYINNTNKVINILHNIVICIKFVRSENPIFYD